MNGWIFIEIIIAGFFLWTVIDPMYVLMVNRFEPKGYEEEGRYVLNLGAYGNNHGMRDTTVTNNMRKEAFYRFIQLIQEQPEVESAYVSLYSSMPNSMSWSGGEYKPDTLSTAEEKITHTQNYYILGAEGCDIFRTLGIKDVHTGKELALPEDASARNLCFISKQFALKMFGTTQAVGEKIFDYENQAIEINRLPFLRIGDMLNEINEYNKKLEFKCFRADDQNRLIALFETDDIVHKIDNRLMDLVNINTQDYTFYTSSNKKGIIVAVRDAENRLLARIMEVK